MKVRCSICGKAVLARGWCSAHYQRWANHGDPLGGAPSPSERGELERFYQEVVLTDNRGPDDPCLTWPFSRVNGRYGKMWVGKGLQLVHRRLCEDAHGPAPTPDHEAAHNCGHGEEACVTKSHVRWATHAENMADKLLHGTHTKGRDHNHASKLTEPEVREILRLKGIKTQGEIAAMFNVCRLAVGKIHRRVAWAWVDAA